MAEHVHRCYNYNASVPMCALFLSLSLFFLSLYYHLCSVDGRYMYIHAPVFLMREPSEVSEMGSD